MQFKINDLDENPKPQLPRVPVVKIDVAAGRVFADSRDMAAYFDKRHDNVLVT